MMLTRSGARKVNIALLILTSIGVCSSVAALVIMIIKQYVGFNISSNPISCSANSYAIKKYNQTNYLNSSDIGQVVSLIASLSALIILIVAMVKLRRSQEQEKQQIKHWDQKIHEALCILYAIGIISIIIPTGYFISFIIEVTKFCTTAQTEWYLIAGTSIFALVCYLICFIYLFQISNNFDPLQQTQIEKQENKQKTIPQQHKQLNEQIKNEPKEAKEETKQQQPGITNQVNKSQQNNLQPQKRQQPLQKNSSFGNIKQISSKQQLKEPLLNSHKQSNRQDQRHKNNRKSSQDQYQSKRLKQLRRQRREQQDKIRQLQRKKHILQMNQLQNTSNNEHIQRMQPTVNNTEKQKTSGNQTIINIHLSKSQQNLPTVQKQGAKREVNQRKSVAKIPKKYKNIDYPIEEQESEYSQKQYIKKKKRKSSDNEHKRFQTRKNMQEHSKPLRPDYYQQPQPQSRKMQRSKSIKPNNQKNLSYNNLPSFFIPPSPKSSNQLSLPINVNSPKNEESFFKKLLEQSQIRQTKNIQAPNAPKKRNVKKQYKISGNQDKKNLDEYIQALNMSLNVNRPDFQQDYFSNSSNYSSVLSNKKLGAMPLQKSERDKFHSFFYKQKIRSNDQPSGLLEFKDRIEKKYKNK